MFNFPLKTSLKFETWEGTNLRESNKQRFLFLHFIWLDFTSISRTKISLRRWQSQKITLTYLRQLEWLQKHQT